jgi:TRAP-type mannitol/chloroaromatic compound transport system permease large subunit
LPILGPIATELGIHQVWFAVLMGINLQTAYLTPPFGFALFYLRGAVPSLDTLDRSTGRTLPGISTSAIYRGAIPFIVIQVIVMVLLIARPGLVLDMLAPTIRMDEVSVDALIREMADRPPSALDGAPQRRER